MGEARSKTYVSEQAFVFDSTDWRFRAPARVVGAGAISDAVDDYVRHGSRREIGIV